MKPKKPCKVLVVEDEGLIAHDISSRLKALGHEVVGTVSTAQEAIEQAGAADIVLMDIRLDGPIDGIEAAAQVRERYHLPVVFLTAHADRATLERAKSAGPYGYIVKPLAHASLNTSIEIALNQHSMERQLEEREAWLRTTLASVADAVVVTGIDGRVRMLNRAAEALTGWIELEAGDQPVSKVVRLIEADSGEPADDPVPVALLRDAPVPLDRTWRLVARDGRERIIEGAAAPIKASGVTLGAVLTFRDVGARRWEEYQLRQSHKARAVERLAAGMSHDYSNLLAIIRNQAQLLLRQFSEHSPTHQAAEEIHQAAVAAEQLTQRLAVFGTPQLKEQEVLTLNSVLRRMSKLIQSIAADRVEVAMRLDPRSGKINADVAQIEQAIMNLVLHSCATMPEGGRLLLETGSADIPHHGRNRNCVFLALTHSGQEPDPEKLFEPASTGDEGLALSMVHGIVTEHGGYVSAQPGANGGFRFELFFPRWSGPALLPRPAGRAPSILLVDYRERVRSQLHNFFEANGYNLLEASDAAEALALGQVHEGAVDLLIADGSEADSIGTQLRQTHPSLEILRLVDAPETSQGELRRPFTQQALLERVEALFASRPKLESAAC